MYTEKEFIFVYFVLLGVQPQFLDILFLDRYRLISAADTN